MSSAFSKQRLLVALNECFLPLALTRCDVAQSLAIGVTVRWHFSAIVMLRTFTACPQFPSAQ